MPGDPPGTHRGTRAARWLLARLTPRTARTSSLIRGEGSERLVRLNYEPALVALDHVLEVRIFMPRREQEAVIPPPNAHVIGEVHADPVNTGSPAAFAENPESVASKRIVDLTQELLILGLPTCSLDSRISRGLGVGHAFEITCPGPTGGKLIADSHRERPLSRVAENYHHVWYWRSRLPERKGSPCRVVARSRRLGSVLVEFEDGVRVVTSRYAVRLK